jgi:hypothetical protein
MAVSHNPDDAALMRTGLSAAGAYGWDELTSRTSTATWLFDAYVPVTAFETLQEELNRFDLNGDTPEIRLSRLMESTNRVLRVAAVIGREFQLDGG